jgi:hypothetical protein
VCSQLSRWSPKVRVGRSSNPLDPPRTYDPGSPRAQQPVDTPRRGWIAQRGRIKSPIISKVVYKGDEVDQEMDACEFVARVLAHVPNPKRHLVHYYGAYSNVARGKRKKAGVDLQTADDIEAPEELSPAQAARRKSWARLIRRVYEVDPLICAKCGGEMCVVSIITDPPVIDHILEHLAARDRTGRPPPSPARAVA